MKFIVPILMLTAMLLGNCTLLRKNYTTVFEQKEDFVWQTTQNGSLYKFEIVTVYDRIWYKGYLHIQNSDSSRTYYLKGFQKGNNHPTDIKMTSPDSTALGFLNIWSSGQYADTLEIENNRREIKVLPESLKLYKIKK